MGDEVGGHGVGNVRGGEKQEANRNHRLASKRRNERLERFARFAQVINSMQTYA